MSACWEKEIYQLIQELLGIITTPQNVPDCNGDDVEVSKLVGIGGVVDVRICGDVFTTLIMCDEETGNPVIVVVSIDTETGVPVVTFYNPNGTIFEGNPIACPIPSDIEYQTVCVDGTTQLTRGDVWQNNQPTGQSFYLGDQGQVVPAPEGVITIGECPVKNVLMTSCYERGYQSVDVCNHRSESQPGPWQYPFDLQVLIFTWVGGDQQTPVSPPQTVNNTVDLYNAINSQMTAMALAGGLTIFNEFSKINNSNAIEAWNLSLLFLGLDSSKTPLFVRMNIGGNIVEWSNMTLLGCEPLILERGQWKKILYQDGSVQWYDLIACETVFPPPPNVNPCPAGDYEHACVFSSENQKVRDIVIYYGVNPPAIYDIATNIPYNLQLGEYIANCSHYPTEEVTEVDSVEIVDFFIPPSIQYSILIESGTATINGANRPTGYFKNQPPLSKGLSYPQIDVINVTGTIHVSYTLS